MALLNPALPARQGALCEPCGLERGSAGSVFERLGVSDVETGQICDRLSKTRRAGAASNDRDRVARSSGALQILDSLCHRIRHSENRSSCKILCGHGCTRQSDEAACGTWQEGRAFTVEEREEREAARIRRGFRREAVKGR